MKWRPLKIELYSEDPPDTPQEDKGNEGLETPNRPPPPPDEQLGPKRIRT